MGINLRFQSRYGKIIPITVDWAQDWGKAGHIAPIWRLYYNSRNGMHIRVHNKTHHLTHDRIYIVPAWLQFVPWTEQPLDHLFIHFDLLDIPPTIISSVFNTILETPSTPYRGILSHLCNDLTTDNKQTEACLRCDALVSLVMADILPTIPRKAAQRITNVSFTDSSIKPALNYITDNLHRPLTNEILARLCAMSINTFIRHFKKASQTTPSEFISLLRISKAAQLLHTDSHTLDEIAEQCGFCDRFHLTKQFTRHMSLPPAQYRKRELALR